MKAVYYEKYGSTEVLELKEIEKPSVSSDEILIKVYAASVQPMDIRFRTGTPLLARAIAGLTKPKIKILGFDYSGVVEAVGENITSYSPGDEVFGLRNSDNKSGTHVEYFTVTENEIGRKPPNLTHIVAATAGMAGIMALQGLRDHGEIKPGKKVLLNGASGGIGTYAVPIAKHYGAEVTGVCSTGNLEMVKSLGADHVIDYTKEDFTENSDSYDVIFDIVRKNTFNNCKKALTEKGIYITTHMSPSLLIEMKLNSNPNSKRSITMWGDVNGKDLEIVSKLLESEVIVPVIDRVYSMEEIADAHRYVEKGHAKGKVILKIA